MRNPGNAIGRVRTVLVFGQGPHAKAVVTTIAVRIRKGNGRQRLRMRGPAHFEDEVLQHYNDTLLPIVDRFTMLLQLQQRRVAFDLSITNCGAASALDRGIKVSGFSADAAVLLAMLSAQLKLAVPQTMVCTAHVGSPEGELRPVQSLAVKLAAACKDPGLRTFSYAAPEADRSLQELTPDLAAPFTSAILQAKDRIRTVPVADVAQLVREAFDESAIVRGALEAGFFGLAQGIEDNGSAIERGAMFLTNALDQRFWRVLETQLLDGAGSAARGLLLARVRHHVRERRYPVRFGEQLLQLLRSLPPSLLRLKPMFPLLPPRACLQFGRLVTVEDYEDVTLLQRAVAGRTADVAGTPSSGAAPKAPVDNRAAAILAEILNELSAETLAESIDRPIDAARAVYVLPTVSADCPGALEDTITAFYLFVLRHIGLAPGPMNDHYRGEALEILKLAYASEGGLPAARAEAFYPVRGGLGPILDGFSTELKAKLHRNRLRHVIETTFNSRDWEERLAITMALYERLRPQLPWDLNELPIARVNDHFAEVIQAYVQVLDNMRLLLRRF